MMYLRFVVVRSLLIVCLGFPCVAVGQELYVFSEPASNMPARSLGLKYEAKLLEGLQSGKLEQRHMLEAQLGISRKLMVHAATTISDMYSYPALRWESVNVYTKYRFYSQDDVHRHFRMAAFLEAAYSRNDLYYDEISLRGDQSGVQAGLILTQLLHKLALSSTLSLVEVLNPERWEDYDGPRKYPYEAFNYSLSAGYLLLPRSYENYNQVNVNIYLELIGSRALDKSLSFTDLAPALQLIFNSTTKINAGYRFQLNGNMNRMAEQRFQIAVETVFLNALKRKK